MKKLDFFGWLVILTITGLTIAAIGTIDFNASGSLIDDVRAHGELPIQLKNWHFVLLLWVIYISGNKS